MLKKSQRSRGAVSSTKQGLMADHHYSIPPSPNGINYTNFPSQRVFVGFTPKSILDANEVAMSPTSILETKPFSTIANSFFADKNPRKLMLEPAHETAMHQPVGLGIVDALKKSSSRPDSRMVLFGSQLKIQIPSLATPAAGAVDSPQSPIEFGIKNKNSQLALFSPATRRSPMEPATLVSGSLSATEMELSEDYTCVIAHGPNPKTTHIFDNCVIESCCGGQGFVPAPAPAAATRKETVFASGRDRGCDRGSGYPADDFLASCHACKKSLGQGKDIFMYRGEKAFCSHECRYLEILFDEGMVDCSPDDPSAIL